MKYFSGLYYKAGLLVILTLIIRTGYTINSFNNYRENSLAHLYLHVENKNDISCTFYDSLSHKDYNKAIKDALDYQLIADSLSRLAKLKRGQLYEISDPRRRIEVISEISRLDKESSEYQAKANEKYNITLSYNNRSPETDTLEEKIRLVMEVNGIKIYQYIPPGITKDFADSILFSDEGKSANIYEVQRELSRADEFYIYEKSPYDDKNPIPSNIKLPVGLIFRIQSGVFSKHIPNYTFGGLSPVSSESVEGKIKYFIGIFYSTKSANKALVNIREYGFPDAFIVPFYNGKVITIEKAKEIEYSQIKL